MRVVVDILVAVVVPYEPNFMILDEEKPVPVIVAVEPTMPEIGEIEVIAGAGVVMIIVVELTTCICSG